MEGGRNKVELDEIEMLLGEIPNVTSGNPHFCDAIVNLDDRLPPDKPTHICGNSSEVSLNEKLLNNENLHDEKSSIYKLRQLYMDSVQPQGRSQPNEQSLTSAFDKLSFTNGYPTEAANPPFASYKSLPRNGTSSNIEYSNTLNNSSLKMDSQFIVPSPLSPDYRSTACCEFDVKRSSQGSLNMLKYDVQELNGHQSDFSWLAGNVPGAFPLANGVQGLQLLPNVPDPGRHDQQHYFLESHALPSYLNLPQFNQSEFIWRDIEEEQRYRLNQRNMYYQQLCNQRVKAQQTHQANGNVAKLMRQNLSKIHFEMPHQFRQYNEEPFFVNHSISRGSNLCSPAISYGDFSSIQDLDKSEKQNFPRKILTRPHGPNPFKEAKSGPNGSKGSVSHFNQNGRVPNGHLSTQETGHIQLDSFGRQDFSISSTGCKITSPSSQPIKYNSLDEVKGKIYFLAKDQHGCRFLQRKFTEGTLEDVEMIFLEIIDYIVELMTDPFGNYLFQKLLEVCTEDQRMQILNAINRKAGDLVKISCDMHGTRAVQKVIETLKSPEQFSKVVSSLEPGIVTLMKNVNGNHVAQRCLQYIMPEYREFLFEAATRNCVELATDRHGCCVLQKCLHHSEGEKRRQLIYEITSNALILSQDQYGNYVVQFVFDLRVVWAAEGILDQLDGNYGDLSVQKYSSNVVEKCLQYARDDRRHRIVGELINSPRLDQIMQDPYGNFVIQAALNHSKGALHSALVEAIKPHVPALRTSPYGKKVLSCNTLKR